MKDKEEKPKKGKEKDEEAVDAPDVQTQTEEEGLPPEPEGPPPGE